MGGWDGAAKPPELAISAVKPHVSLGWLVLGKGPMRPGETEEETELAQPVGIDAGVVGAKSDKEFAQKLAEQCHEMLKSTQKRLPRMRTHSTVFCLCT